MIIAVDLDGVCYEFQKTYRYMLREHRGVEMPPLDEFWDCWDAYKAYGTEADHEWMWTWGVERGLFRYGHMTTGARLGLEALVTDGHEIKVVTHRIADATPDTVDWLSLYFNKLPYTLSILSNGEDKHSVDAGVLIDDRYSIVDGWCAQGRWGIVFKRAWSEIKDCSPNLHVANDWKGVLAVVRSL